MMTFPARLAVGVAATALALALAGCGGAAAAAEARACGVARAAQKGTGSAAMDGAAMTTYATALAAARATGALAQPVGQAISDARNAAADARHRNRAQYQADAELFRSDLAAIASECQQAAR